MNRFSRLILDATVDFGLLSARHFSQERMQPALEVAGTLALMGRLNGKGREAKESLGPDPPHFPASPKFGPSRRTLFEETGEEGGLYPVHASQRNEKAEAGLHVGMLLLKGPTFRRKQAGGQFPFNMEGGWLPQGVREFYHKPAVVLRWSKSRADKIGQTLLNTRSWVGSVSMTRPEMTGLRLVSLFKST